MAGWCAQNAVTTSSFAVTMDDASPACWCATETTTAPTTATKYGLAVSPVTLGHISPQGGAVAWLP